MVTTLPFLRNSGVLIAILAALGCASCSGADGVRVATTSPRAATKASTDALPSTEWVTETVPECGIVAEFPVAPIRSEETLRDGGKVVMLGVALPNDKGSVVLGCGDMGQSNRTPRVLLDDAREATLKSVDATLVEEKEVANGRVVIFRANGEVGLAHILLAGDKVASGLVLPVRGFGSANTRHFLASVRPALTAPR